MTRTLVSVLLFVAVEIVALALPVVAIAGIVFVAIVIAVTALVRSSHDPQ